MKSNILKFGLRLTVWITANILIAIVVTILADIYLGFSFPIAIFIGLAPTTVVLFGKLIGLRAMNESKAARKERDRNASKDGVPLAGEVVTNEQ